MKYPYLRAVKFNNCCANTIDNYQNNLLVPLLFPFVRVLFINKVKQYESIP